MTNPANAMRMLITYAITIPLAILVGYLITDPLDYGILLFFGLVVLLILSPIFIKWHYPILVFGLGCPMSCFFLIGKPPLWQAVVILCLGIAIIERTVGDRRFLSVPVVSWPLLYIAAMTYLTANLTGGIGLHQLGGAGGGGKKYLIIFIGIASFFALTSRTVPKERRNLYIALFVLSPICAALGDIAAVLGGPFHVINLFFPSSLNFIADAHLGKTRLGALGAVFSTMVVFMLVKYGMRGIFLSNRLWRAPVFIIMFALTMMGGFRSLMFTLAVIFILLFFMEGLHHSRLMPVFILVGLLGLPIVGFFSNQLPFVFQRSMSFLPLKWDADVLLDAQGSTEWRENMWRALWPTVPDHLLLGKGYSMTAEDFQNIGGGAFAGLGAGVDASQETLAISGDYHNGPLTTLIPFGVWGGIGMLWLMAAGLFVYYRNYRFGDPELKTFNAYFLACGICAVFNFFFIFGGFHDDVFNAAKSLGFSIAMNRGICRPPPKPVTNFRLKPLPAPQPA